MFKTFALGAALLAACMAASAQHTVQERKAVMEAQIELLKKQGELNKALQDVAGNSAASLPQILAIMGLDGVMVARLQLSNGTVNSYLVGETIRPGMVVASITSRQVSVTVGTAKNARAMPLEFIAGANSAQGQHGFAPLPGGRLAIPRELLPDPPAVRLPSTAMPPALPAAVPAPAPAPAASPSASPAAFVAPAVSAAAPGQPSPTPKR